MIENCSGKLGGRGGVQTKKGQLLGPSHFFFTVVIFKDLFLLFKKDYNSQPYEQNRLFNTLYTCIYYTFCF